MNWVDGEQEGAAPISRARHSIPEPPRGWSRLRWLGPSFLWMLSAAGSGELLFTPRIAALYGYSLLWALIAAVVLKWFINREVGRFTVCTGAKILEGFHGLAGPRDWAVWVILVPQVFVAIATVAGMAGAAATALRLLSGGPLELLTALIVMFAAAIVFLGRYQSVETISSYIGVGRSIAVVVAAVLVFPSAGRLGRGLLPQIPPNVQFQEVLPWLGFMLAGAAGLMWYSYWVEARGYGAAAIRQEAPLDLSGIGDQAHTRLRGWLSLMTMSNTLAVVGALLAALSFLILGGELLRPKNLVPKEEQVAETLGRLLGELWGPFGFWFMIAIVFITFCSTTLSVQDGFARMFADGTKILLRSFGFKNRWAAENFLRKLYILVLLCVLPIAVYLIFGQPVALLQLAGGVEAAHIPVVTALTLYLNHRMLPKELKPSRLALTATIVAGAFFAVFASIYVLQIAGVIGGGK